MAAYKSLGRRLSQPIRSLVNDYYEVLKDTAVTLKRKPFRAVTLSLISAAGAYLWRTNPTHTTYCDEILQYSNEISQCSVYTRNPVAQDYINHVIYLNCNSSLKYINLGFLSLVVERPHAKDCANYLETCKELQPRWWQYRVLDVGVANKWLLLEREMVDFDVINIEI